MKVSERVAALRQWMATHHDGERPVGAFIVSTADPHNDEYIPSHWMCREWLTAFTGSAGTAVVTADSAALWTDSRYWLQAAEQLEGTPFQLMREGADGVPTVGEWIAAQEAFAGAQPDAPAPVVGVSVDAFSAREAASLAADGVTVTDRLSDAFDDLWTDRPAIPAEPVTVQKAEFAGETIEEKLGRLRQWTACIATSMDYLFADLADIAWVLNLRGADIPYNPVFVAYLVYRRVTDDFQLFTHVESLTAEARAQLQKAGVELAPYAEALSYCRQHTVGCDPSTATLLLRSACTPSEPSPLAGWRSVKNAAEAEGFRRAMERDGVAMVRFLRQFEESLAAGEQLTEISVDQRLTALRAEQPGYEQLSFATIAACGPHGAIVHYEAEPETDAVLPRKSFLLLDSGAQYDCGTTDITRTIALGDLTREERLVYTLVFKGHLRLARMKFPEGTTGLQLDLAARQDLWARGYDFGHGTGHGVGAHLCVHEGPQQIRKNLRDCTLVPFRPGMTITDEPGVYVEGAFGVRIENTLLCVPAEETAFGRFLRFESLTLCPYDLRPVMRSLLTVEEVEQINQYHAEVRHRLLPLLSDEADRCWLANATRSIELDYES